MRCIACNANLDDVESVSKDMLTGRYLDMCRVCLQEANIYCNITAGDYDENDKRWSSSTLAGFFRGVGGKVETASERRDERDRSYSDQDTSDQSTSEEDY